MTPKGTRYTQVLAAGEEIRCAADCEGEVFQPPGEAEIADLAAVAEVEMITKALTRGTSSCAECCAQCIAVRCVLLDAENVADDVRTRLDDVDVLGDRVNKVYRAAVDAAETGWRQNISI